MLSRCRPPIARQCWRLVLQRWKSTNPATAQILEEQLFSLENEKEVQLIYDTSVVSSQHGAVVTNQLTKRLLKPAQLDEYSFDRLRYYLHPNTKDQLHLFSNLHFVNPAAATHFASSCPNFSGILLLHTLARNTELYQEAIAKALARHYDAQFLALDPWDIAVQRGAENDLSLQRRGRQQRMTGRPPGLQEQVVFMMHNMEVVKAEPPHTAGGPDSRSKADERFRAVIKSSMEAFAAAHGDKGQPCVLFLRDFPAIITNEKRVDILRGQLAMARKERPVVVVASSGAGSAGDREKAGEAQVLLQKLMSMNEPEEDQGGSLAEVEGVCNVWVHEPTEQTDRDRWLKQLEVDAHIQTHRANHRLLAKVLTEARVGHDSLARVRGLDTQAMEPHEGELLVGWALSRHAKEQLPAAEYLKELAAQDAEAKEELQHAALNIETTEGESAPEELVPEAVVQPEIVNTRPRSRTSTLSKNAPMMYMTAGDLQHSCDLWLTARDLAVITGQQPVKPMGAKEMPKLNQWEKKLAANLLTPGTLDVKFDDIGSLDTAKKLLKEIISLPLQRTELFSRGVLAKSVSGVLLFGPPGTGKTMLAKAVAAESGSNFLHVSLSDVMQEFVGQSEKCAKAVFTLARKMAPCVIFLDEVDSLFAARGARSAYTTKREALNEFMMEWDGLKSHNGRVIVMAATNRPFDLDEAVIRRMPRRLMIDLPDARAREQILKVILRQEVLGEDVEISKLAAQCDGYSGSDLNNLCLAAAMRSVREIIEREEKTGERHYGQPCIQWRHFIDAKGDIKKSVAEDTESSRQLQEWNAKYGEGAKGSARPAIGFAAIPITPTLREPQR